MPTFFAILFDIFLCVLSKSNVGLHILLEIWCNNLCNRNTIYHERHLIGQRHTFSMRFKNNEIRFSKLRVSLFAQNQSATSENFLFIVLNRESNDLWEWKTFISSAKRIKNKVEDTLGRSLMQIRNSRGPRFESCGTPNLITSRSEKTPLQQAHWRRLSR